MSSSERFGDHRIRRGLSFLACGLALFLTACTAQPLYGTSGVGQHTIDALDGIIIDPVTTRVAQQVRNKLIFELNSRRAGGAAKYRMRLAVTTNETPLGVTPVESAPASIVNVTVTFTVTALDSDDIVLRDTARASASYDLVNQVFSNVRAKRDAEDRAATVVANDIRVRLAAAAARSVI
ncbi:MAG: LPS assembly lipoprotein LptE [Alphaproteobacteria bacterium]